MNSETIQIDEVFHWEGFGKCESKCRIRVFSDVIIATELLKENVGTSITNDAENLINKVCTHYRLNPLEITWIEHYPKGAYPEEFSKVTIVAGEARWTHLTKKDVELLVGYPL